MKGKVLFSTLVALLCFSLSTVGIMASVPKDKSSIKDNDVVVKSNVEEMTVETTEAETYINPYGGNDDVEEETKKKKKKKLKAITIGGNNDDSSDAYNYDNSNDYSDGNDYSYDDSSFDDSSYDDNSSGGAVNNYYYGDDNNNSSKKKNSSKKNTSKKKNSSNKNTKKNTYRAPVIKKKAIPSQSEKNALSSNKVNILRGQIKGKISGSSNSELTNLAKYMAKNNLSNASSTYKKLTRVSGNIDCATYKLKVSSGDQLAILEVANKIHEVSANKYGIGISSTQVAVGYKIYVVICYK